MTERLSLLDVGFLHVEGPTTPMHLGELAILDPAGSGFDYERLVDLIERRIPLAPRYRQKVRWVPGNLANPVWVDDPSFDVTYHVRRSALPKPGTDRQLLEFCARIQARSLDRSRPLWEMYLIEGLEGGRIALVTKTHQSMVDGIGAIDLNQVVLDASPTARSVPDQLWMPEPEPSGAALVLGALVDAVRRPTAVLDTVRLTGADLRATTTVVSHLAAGLLSAAAAAIRPAPPSPLNRTIGEQRRMAIARTRLEDYKTVRAAHGVTVNDIVLAAIAGALRAWLLSRGGGVGSSSTIRVMLPMSIRTDPTDDQPGAGITALLVDLPVGEPNPLLRLAQVSYATKAHRESAQSVRADALAALSGFAPPTLHALGARAAGGLARRAFNLILTNVPGPQFPLYAGGARLLEVYPILPLTAGQSLSIGLTSYNGGVYYGLNGDRDAMPDLDVLADLIEESLSELVEASAATSRARTGGRLKTVMGGAAGRGRSGTAGAAGKRTGRPDRSP